MKNILDSIPDIKKLDSQNMLGSLELLGEQVKQVAKLALKLKLPASYRKVDRLVILGMGGSTLGAHVIKTLFFSVLKLPVDIVNGYHVPAFVNQKTLVIASSYSGTTEEPLAALKEALNKKAKVVVITSGGSLAAQAKRYKIPALIFTTENNPCGSPRMGLGYMIAGKLAILAAARLITFGAKEINILITTIVRYQAQFGATIVRGENVAKQAALKTTNCSVWYMASEHLAGNAHIGANQMNENGKRFAGYFLIPELNHHLLEGMKQPKTNTENLLFILIESALYDERVQTRYDITKSILQKNNINHLVYRCQEKSLLGQVAEVLLFTSYASYYAAVLEGIDPTAIPFVDFFKVALAKK